MVNTGHVRIFEYDGTSWTQKGSSIPGVASDDKSGYSVSLSSDGTIVAIGAIIMMAMVLIQDTLEYLNMTELIGDN